MTTDLPSATTSPGRPATDEDLPASMGTARVRIVGAGLGFGAAAIAAMLVWKPWGERDELGYDAVRPIRDHAWTGTTVDAFAFALVSVTLAVATCALVRRRGRHWADVGAVVTVVGGIAFAMGGFARGAVVWLATADQVPADAGATVLQLVEDEPGHLMALAMAGFLLYTLGTLALTVAWWRSRVVPRWLTVALVVFTVAQFSGIDDRPLDLVQVACMGVLVCFAVFFVGRPQRQVA
jgi:hypothetical protein